MISQPERPILEIALEYGYGTHESFTRTFKQIGTANHRSFARTGVSLNSFRGIWYPVRKDVNLWEHVKMNGANLKYNELYSELHHSINTSKS